MDEMHTFEEVICELTAQAVVQAPHVSNRSSRRYTAFHSQFPLPMSGVRRSREHRSNVGTCGRGPDDPTFTFRTSGAPPGAEIGPYKLVRLPSFLHGNRHSMLALVPADRHRDRKIAGWSVRRYLHIELQHA